MIGALFFAVCARQTDIFQQFSFNADFQEVLDEAFTVDRFRFAVLSGSRRRYYRARRFNRRGGCGADF
jgi:uncharacterized Fe-S cluster-containing radical SAM superfamily protein